MAFKSSLLSDILLFSIGATSAIFVFFLFFSFISTNPISLFPFPTKPTFFSDPTLSYTISTPLTNWDSKRSHWLSLHPNSSPKVLLLSGSQPTSCSNPIGDHLLFRLLKNKLDYSRIHNYNFFYNTALFHASMFEYWNKIPTIRSAMVAHPEAEWIWWVDSDAVITDIDFELPFEKYQNFNLVVHGWPEMVFGNKSWTGLNAGVFLIRNCQWSVDFMEEWAAMGPQTENYKQWGKTLKKVIKDKLYPESDDQSGLVYLLNQNVRWREKVYLENEFYFEGYWVDVVGKLEGWNGGRNRIAEVDRKETSRDNEDRKRPPFVTHFTGCQPCSGRHNQIYSGEECWNGIKKALEFADDQVLWSYGFRHVKGGKDGEVQLIEFQPPAN